MLSGGPLSWECCLKAHLKVALGDRTLGMHYTFWDPFSVDSGQLLLDLQVLQKHGAWYERKR